MPRKKLLKLDYETLKSEPKKKPLKRTPKQPKTVAKLKKDADKYWSLATRYRFANPDGTAECVTCGVRKSIKELQCGHFMSRRFNNTRFSELNTAPQCLTADSKVDMYGNYRRSIADLITGDVVLAFDEKSFKKTVATVLSVDSFVPEKLYEVELEDGSKFFATADHRVVANGEWAYIKDMLHSVSTYDILEL